MQAFIGIIATAAMVMHFTFGCCAHPCHFIGHTNSAATQAEVATAGCCHHGHAHPGHSHATAQNVEQGEHGAGIHPGCHDCDGCTCVATVSGKVIPPTDLPLVAFLSIKDEAEQLLSAADFRLLPDPFAYAGLRPHSIFERFLI